MAAPPVFARSARRSAAARERSTRLSATLLEFTIREVFMRRARFPDFRTAIGAARWAALLTAAMLVMNDSRLVRAQGEFAYPAYSFEGDLQGFGPNGAVTISLDTIGATDGANSMKFAMPSFATFVGALTSTLAPQVGDPPGLDFVVFDLTITEQVPAEGFVSAGITVFGASQPDFPGGQRFGEQAQFQFDENLVIGDLAINTPHEVRIDLTQATHPLTGAAASFEEIFGNAGTGPNDLIPTGFQIYINKSNTAPWTGYIDNVRLGVKFDADFNVDTAVNSADLGIWKGAFELDVLGDADGDLDTDGNDFLIWQQQLGPTIVAAGVPEPATLWLAACGVAGAAVRRRTFASRLDGSAR
jgi:hypothetical protein